MHFHTLREEKGQAAVSWHPHDARTRLHLAPEGQRSPQPPTIAGTGTDADHFAQVPHGRPPRPAFTLGGENGSFIELPLRHAP